MVSFYDRCIAHICSRTPINDNQAATGSESDWLKIVVGSSPKPHETRYLAPSSAVVFDNLVAFFSW
jgi:hypothetical protein